MAWPLYLYGVTVAVFVGIFIYLMRRDYKDQIHRANELNRIMHQRDADLECWLRDMLKNKSKK